MAACGDGFGRNLSSRQVTAESNNDGRTHSMVFSEKHTNNSAAKAWRSPQSLILNRTLRDDVASALQKVLRAPCNVKTEEHTQKRYRNEGRFEPHNGDRAKMIV